jgi:hypothetical protein
MLIFAEDLFYLYDYFSCIESKAVRYFTIFFLFTYTIHITRIRLLDLLPLVITYSML